jgi:proteasome beta subunit
VDRSSAYATGNGGLFAYALLQKYESVIPRISVAKAGLLAYRVIEEAIQVGSYGVGPPIDVWQITPEGIENLSEEKIVGLADTSKLLREAEIKAFLEE